MKSKTIVSIVLVLLAYTIQAQENNFKLNADFSNLKADSVYLQSYGNKGMLTIASAKCNDGKFSLEGYIEFEDNYYLTAKTPGIEKPLYSQIFVEKCTLHYSGEFGRYPLYKVEGSKYAKNVYAFHADPEYQKLRKEILEYDLRELSDEEKIAQQKLQRKLYNFIGNVDYKWFDEGHPKHQIHLADQYYYDKEFDKFKKQAEYLKNTYPTHPGVQRIQRVLQFLNEREKEKSLGKEPKSRIGTSFSDVILNDKYGKEFKLSDAVKQNKLVLLDFWASWCGPCRAEFPHLRLAYKAYKDKGFEIFAVSMDAKNEAWLKALEEEKTEWINVVDLDAWNSKFGKDYNVKGIPYNVLINTEGKIIGERLRGEALEELLEKELNH